MVEGLKLAGFYILLIVIILLLIGIQKRFTKLSARLTELTNAFTVLKSKGKIVIHHSASPTQIWRSGKIIPVDADVIREWHQTKGWSDIGYHYVIMPDGRCENGRPLCRGGVHCHSGHCNSGGIGVCLVGNFSEIEVPEAQLQGLINKVTQLLTTYNLGVEDVELHRNIEGCSSECPGRYFPADVLMRELGKSMCGSLY